MAQPTTLPSADAQRQAAVTVFAQYEPPLYEAYLDMMLEWLAAVKVAMFTGGVARLGLVPDPMTVFSQTPKWTSLMARYAEDVAREVLAAPYKDLFADGTLFESRPFVRNWISQRENRLAAVPNEVFGLVSHIIDSATVNGATIPDVTAQVEELFTDTGVQRWKNRARTVARTEVVGAYNGGIHDAFSMIVQADPGTEWVKRWLATDDQRTRPDHREADGQVVPFSQPFIVGGFRMMYPHDPDGPPQEVINCRCTPLLEIKNDATVMSNRQYLGASIPAYTSLMQAVCDDGSFCMQTHKPGLCKGQKRGQAEPGAQDETKKTPAQQAQIAVDGLTRAIAQAQAVAAQNATNPKLAAMARKAVAGYRRALVPHQQTLRQAAGTNAHNKTVGNQDTHQQDVLDRAAQRKANADQRHRETLRKRAQAILDRRAEKAKVAKMTPKQRAAYGKRKSAEAKARHQQAENRTLKEASKA
jgi:hypothetical protein